MIGDVLTLAVVLVFIVTVFVSILGGGGEE